MVDERVEEAERALALVEELVVEERDHARECRARRGGARHELALPSDVDDEVDALRGDVGERAALGVEEARVGVAELLEIPCDRVVLVRRTGEDVGEAAGGELGGGLINALGATDRSQAGREGPLASSYL